MRHRRPSSPPRFITCSFVRKRCTTLGSLFLTRQILTGQPQRALLGELVVKARPVSELLLVRGQRIVQLCRLT